ncbi:hypothetical protein BGU17_19035 [Clostridioides difficile]|nr:hypothetical protein BGU17_19035 [Clostridioides difficile]
MCGYRIARRRLARVTGKVARSAGPAVLLADPGADPRPVRPRRQLGGPDIQRLQPLDSFLHGRGD